MATSSDAPASGIGDLGDDRRKHLDFIQTVVGRMFSASNLAKGWCLTVATVTFGYALTRNSPAVALLGLFAVLLFGFLDASYLCEERKFRALYEDARLGHVDLYDMRTGPYFDKTHAKFDRHCAWPCVLRSWSLWGFYGPLILVSVLVLSRACIVSQ